MWGKDDGATLEDWTKTIDGLLAKGVKVILNAVNFHLPFVSGGANHFKTAEQLTTVESYYKRRIDSVAYKLWGIIFLGEEHYRYHCRFEDITEDVTWFDTETLRGYESYRLNENPTATLDEWNKEMYLRMVRGFTNYYKARVPNVGITLEQVDKPEAFFGTPALEFIRDNMDFIFCYPYCRNLNHFNSRVKNYFSVLDGYFVGRSKPVVFWILTRPWGGTVAEWQREAIALEMKNCLDRSTFIPVVTTYASNIHSGYDILQWWSDIRRCMELYEAEESYFEEYVYGRNLLTNQVGNTYGFVAPPVPPLAPPIPLWKLAVVWFSVFVGTATTLKYTGGEE